MTETEEIKDRLPIEQVIGGYLPLKKAGRIFKGLCPFHQEKTPSFTVSPERGIFKCFGCGEGGDIFDFVIKIEGLTFPETIRLLAEKSGVTLKEWKPTPSQAASEPIVSRDRLFQLNTYAAKLWHTLLLRHEKAESARGYLKSRAVDEESITKFQIGYAPPSHATVTSLKQKGFTLQEMAQAGDPSKFQDRIVFPIGDITGRIIAFTGRLLEHHDDPKSETSRGPKYWNSPETPLFIKSKAVYALHLAKQSIQTQDLAVLAEGQMDVVMLHQAGCQNAVASSGTALTIEQIRLIGRFSQNIAFAYDSDMAGIQATKRGIELVLAAEYNPYIINIPGGKDPAEAIAKNPTSWKEAYANKQPFMTWLINQTIPKDTTLTPIQKKEAAKEIVPWLAKIHDPLERADWVRLTAAHLQTSEGNLRQVLARQNPLTARPTEKKIEKAINGLSPLLRISEQGAALLLSFPDILPGVKNYLANFRLVGTTSFLDIVLPILEKIGTEKMETAKDIQQILSKQLGSQKAKETLLYVEELMRSYQEIELDSIRVLEEVSLILQRLRTEAKEEVKARLARQIQQAQILGDQVKLKELFSELKNLI